MAKQNELGRLIAAAASAALAPVDCFRRGQSRVWLSDERYWVIMIEFQPSGFSQGSYLNVGASWLWYEKKSGGLNFNAGDRIDDAGFAPFESKEQFRPLIGAMAMRAAQEVLAIRTKFSSIDAISRYLNTKPQFPVWGYFHSAVAAGLNGEVESSRAYFGKLLALPISADWHADVHAEAARLAETVNDPGRFRCTVEDVVRRRRMGARLPPVEDCLPPPNGARDETGKTL